ncbi:NTP transferase domain-containing protein [Nocardia sp. KC 131]|uniref:NTP transferase domain-containing protein n=1 Tax=Nocardia arseniciresistens TaxID=3392119 RepID=UPI00398EF565
MTAADAIILAGGRASRMGGVDKPAIVIGGRSMLESALAAVAGCVRTVVVGPHRPELDSEIRQVREVPPGSGPVAAVDAGLCALGAAVSPLVVVLAADMPFLTDAVIVELIRHATESGADAVFAADESGRPQYLTGVWRRSALAAALKKLDSPVNQPMKALVPTDTVTVTMPGIADCDTDEQVRRARAAARTVDDGAVSEVGQQPNSPSGSAGSSTSGGSASGGSASVPPASVPPASVPPASAPPASVPPASVPPASAPSASATSASGEPASGGPASATSASAPSAASATELPLGTGQPAPESARYRSPATLDEARNMLRTRISRLTAYRADLHSVRGAALAAPLSAIGPLPRFDVSAMDGYAVAGEGPWRLRRDIGFAGGQRPVGLLTGEAVRIATGAHVPDGTTHVVRDEFARVEADKTLHRLPGTPLRDDIRRSGEDRKRGDLVAPEGTRVGLTLISAAASVEATEALVRGPVRARIIMTGDEIRSRGPLHAGQTRDSIGPVLPDMLSWYGIHTIARVHLRDTPNGFDEVLTAATDCDLLVIVGATGGGAADQLRSALTRADARILVHRLRLRPGGSTVVAELPNGTAVLGLPGNPFAAVATLMSLAPALVDGRTGAMPQRALTGPLHNASEIAGPVPRVVPARSADNGGWLGDADIRTAHLGGLIDRDGLVIVPAEAMDGDRVEFLPLRA